MIVFLANKTQFRDDVLKGSDQLFASKYRTVLPTEPELIAELERESRVIERKQNGGDT
jgi:hypothetical protein